MMEEKDKGGVEERGGKGRKGSNYILIKINY